jgi:CHAT domain
MLALALDAGAHQTFSGSEPERQAAQQLSSPGLAEHLSDGTLDPDQVRNALATLQPRLDCGDKEAARAVLSGAEALASWLKARKQAPDERLRLHELRVRAYLVSGELQEAVQLVYQLEGRLRETGQVARAKAVVQSVLDRLPPEHEGRPWLLLAQAEIARQGGRFEDAGTRLDEASDELAAKHTSATTRSLLEPAVLGVHTQIQLDQGLMELAAGSVQDEFDQLRTARDQGHSNVSSWAAAYLRQASVRLAYGRFDRMAAELEAALADLATLPDPKKRLVELRPQLELNLAIARYLDGKGDARRADETRRALQRLWESDSVDELARFQCAEWLAQVELAANELVAAQGWIDKARRLEEERRAQGGEVGIKEQAYLSALQVRLSCLRKDEPSVTQQHVALLRADFDRMRGEWNQQPAREAGLGYLRYNRTRTILGELLSAEESLAGDVSGAERALQVLHLADESGSLHRLLQAAQPTLEETQEKLLPPGTGALVYFPFLDRSLVFTVDAEQGVQLHVCASERSLADLGRQWTAVLFDSPAELDSGGVTRRAQRLDELGARLSQGLLPQDVEQRVETWSTIYVVGSEYLNELPFEALPLGDRGPLGLVKAVCYLPSLPIGVRLFERAGLRETPRTRDLCLIAGIERAKGEQAFEDLPLGDEELESLCAPFPRERVLRLVGAKASLAEVRRADLSQFRIAHFFTHGIQDDLRERPQGLALSGKDVLWCEDAQDLRAPSLVLISACGAGRGPQREGDGPIAHLGGAFLLAGADCVVLSNADLEFEATLALCARFQRELAAECTPAEALRRARLQVAATKGTGDPFYWALVRAIGLAGRPLR